VDCDRLEEVINAYLDQELPGDEMLAVRRHLDDCGACTRQFRDLLQLKQLLSTLREPAPSRPFEPAQLEQPLLRVQVRRWKDYASAAALALRRPARVWGLRLGWCFAAALALALIGQRVTGPSSLDAALAEELAQPVHGAVLVEGFKAERGPGHGVRVSGALRCMICGERFESPVWSPPSGIGRERQSPFHFTSTPSPAR